MWSIGNKDNKSKEMVLKKKKKPNPKRGKKRRNICAWLYSASFIKNDFTDCHQKQ